MRIRILAPALLLVAVAGCNNPLDTTPYGSIPEANAIVDQVSAQAALTGAYNALQSLSSYGEKLVLFGDLSADNSDASGTSSAYREAAQHQLRANNSSVLAIWSSAYDVINRSNEIITRVPGVPGIDTTTRNEIMGEAYFLRALSYHNLVKLFGGVPIRLTPAKSVDEAKNITRATVAAVYDQILKDLDSAQAGITNTSPTTQATTGAVQALRARVLLYKGDYLGADAAAQAVEGMGYTLAANYSDLYSATGSATPEDIFRVIFNPQQESFLSYDYYTRGLGGIWAASPSHDLMHAYDPNYNPDSSINMYNPTDLRGKWNIRIDGRRVYGAKYRSITGTEYQHVIRFGEILLIRAEALAREGHLPEAVAEYNPLRVRAGLPPDTLGTTIIGPSNVLDTQDEVIARILNERRLELAFEGDRWPDLVRTGLAESVLGISTNKTLYPIPKRELDVSPGLTQNPGY